MPSGRHRKSWARGSEPNVWHDERMVTLVRISLRLIEDALRWVALLFRSTESVQPRTSCCGVSWRCTSSAASSRATGSCCDSGQLGRSGKAVRLAQRTCCRAARNDDPLASSWLRLFWRSKCRPGRPPIPWCAGPSGKLRGSRSLSPDIDWRRVCSCSPNRCWAVCITSTRSQRRRRRHSRCPGKTATAHARRARIASACTPPRQLTTFLRSTQARSAARPALRGCGPAESCRTRTHAPISSRGS
jgi:hypothetical protein